MPAKPKPPNKVRYRHGAYHYAYTDPMTKRRIERKLAAGPEGRTTLDAALVKKKEIDDAIAQGSKGPARKRPKVKTAWAEFIVHRQNDPRKRDYAPSTLSDYRSAYKRYISILDNIRVDELTDAHFDLIEEALATAEGKDGGPLSDKRKDNVRLVLKSFLSFCHKQRYTTRALNRDISTQQHAATGRPIPPRKDWEKLLKSIPAYWLPFTETMLYTGQRYGEICASLEDDYDLRKKQVYVRQALSRGEIKTPKTRMGLRYIPLTDRTIATLKAWKKTKPQSPYMFPQPNGNIMCPDNFRNRVWNPARTAAKLPDIQIGDARHTYLTWLVERKIPAAVIQSVAGHESFDTTRRYVASRDPQLQMVRDAFRDPKPRIKKTP